MKTTRKVMAAFLAAATALTLAACGGTTDGGQGDGASKKTQSAKETVKKEITIKQLPWSVSEGIDGGDRRVKVDYTNNTAYDITDFRVDYAWKADTTDDQLVQSFADIDAGATAADIRGGNPYCEVRAHTKAGAQSSDTCGIGFYYLTGQVQLDLAEPNMLTVEYIDTDANALKTVYYDFKTKKMSEDSDSTPLSVWPANSPRAGLLPKPETKLLTDLSDSDNQLMFDMIGVTQADFQKYSNDCVAQGWTVKTSMDDLTYFNAKDGFTLDLMYDADSSKLSVYLNAEK